MPSSMRAGPASFLLDRRGSTHVGGSGLFVLGLGALVLLTGLPTPAPVGLDPLALAGVTAGSGELMLPTWLAGVAMTGVVMLVIGARKRVNGMFLLAMSGI